MGFHFFGWMHGCGYLQRFLSNMQNSTLRGPLSQVGVAFTVLTLCWAEERALLSPVHCGDWWDEDRSWISLCSCPPPTPPSPFVCFYVVLCLSAVTDRAPSPPPGSAMAGLNDLIGAEERIINSKPKMGENVVSPGWDFMLLTGLTCELRAALLKLNNRNSADTDR